MRKYMKTTIRIFILVLIFGAWSLLVSFPAQASDLTNEPLLQKSNLTYLGAFKLPDVPYGGGNGATYGFDYATTSIAFNPAHNSLFINNHIYEQKTAELSIPSTLSTATTLRDLPTASFLQNFSDITQGHINNIGANRAVVDTSGTYMGGLMVWGNKLIGTSYGYYDAGYVVALSHFTASLDLSNPNFAGMYKIGSLNPGFYDGYMTKIPLEWQSLFGGPALTGNCCMSIIGRTSLGPAASVFDPDKLGVVDPVPATTVVAYPLTHPTLGTYGDQNPNSLYNGSLALGGIVFAEGTRSVLFFGRRGTGNFCYGAGTTDPALDHKPLPEYPNGEVIYCYDPANNGKGGHSYPYLYEVVAYDANDLVSVKNGSKNYWEVVPYAHWSLSELPVTAGVYLQGTAYDPATQRIYVSQASGEHAYPDAGAYDAKPIIHVYQVNNAAPVTKQGDLNNDNKVDIFDYNLLVGNFGRTGSGIQGDIDLNGKVDIFDYNVLVGNFGR